MKTFNEIKREARALRANLCDTEKTQKELDGFALRDAVRNGDPDEIAKARKTYKAAEARYLKECEHNENIKLKLEILKDNALCMP